ncbi:hypothetical protein Celaphus_00013881 [Cervus elaphus hippelaphus]|uniref:Uncharacterized protein n=1 Tax=Cervus elaphus hippelaphus TaxID=46360 RepID=A0A212CCH9_CEREH|nr:hypothetical protein Celaphus_00013881 [Cervus elaphus hippelaphus]
MFVMTALGIQDFSGDATHKQEERDNAAFLGLACLMCRKYRCLPVNQKIKQSMAPWLTEPISLTFIDCLPPGMVDNLSWAPPLRPAGTAAYDRTLGEDFGGLTPGNLAHSVFLG